MEQDQLDRIERKLDMVLTLFDVVLKMVPRTMRDKALALVAAKKDG